jgi:hypothetical protein
LSEKLIKDVRFVAGPHGASMIARLLMPWMFVGRKSAWKPFAKVRRD